MITNKHGHVVSIASSAGHVSPRVQLGDRLALSKPQQSACRQTCITPRTLVRAPPAALYGRRRCVADIPCSLASQNGVPGLGDYCASKFAAVGLNESLRLQLRKDGSDGVHTTVVCPYFIDTGMFKGIRAKQVFPCARGTRGSALMFSADQALAAGHQRTGVEQASHRPSALFSRCALFAGIRCSCRC